MLGPERGKRWRCGGEGAATGEREKIKYQHRVKYVRNKQIELVKKWEPGTEGKTTSLAMKPKGAAPPLVLSSTDPN